MGTRITLAEYITALQLELQGYEDKEVIGVEPKDGYYVLVLEEDIKVEIPKYKETYDKIYKVVK